MADSEAGARIEKLIKNYRGRGTNRLLSAPSYRLANARGREAALGGHRHGEELLWHRDSLARRLIWTDLRWRNLRPQPRPATGLRSRAQLSGKSVASTRWACGSSIST